MPESSFIDKYRPKTFDDIIGQDHTLLIIRNTLKRGLVRRVYLIDGPPGTGKSTLARLMGREILGPGVPAERVLLANSKILPYDELNSFVFKDTSEKKVVLLEDAQFLSRDAQALIRSLDESARNDLTFILVTSEAFRLDYSLRVRAITLPLVNPSIEEIISLLGRIAKSEGFDFIEEVARTIVMRGGNSVRQAIQDFDQIYATHGKVDKDSVSSYFGVNGHLEAIDFLMHLATNIQKAMSVALEYGYQRGFKQFFNILQVVLADIFRMKMGRIKDLMLLNPNTDKSAADAISMHLKSRGLILLSQYIHDEFSKSIDSDSFVGQVLYMHVMVTQKIVFERTAKHAVSKSKIELTGANHQDISEIVRNPELFYKVGRRHHPEKDKKKFEVSSSEIISEDEFVGGLWTDVIQDDETPEVDEPVSQQFGSSSTPEPEKPSGEDSPSVSDGDSVGGGSKPNAASEVLGEDLFS